MFMNNRAQGRIQNLGLGQVECQWRKNKDAEKFWASKCVFWCILRPSVFASAL